LVHEGEGCSALAEETAAEWESGEIGVAGASKEGAEEGDSFVKEV